MTVRLHFVSADLFKNPLDKLNFVVNSKNLTVLLWESEFSLCSAVWVFVLVWFFNI